MRELVFEILLRLSRVVLATLLGLVVWPVATGSAGAAGSVELWPCAGWAARRSSSWSTRARLRPFEADPL